jgi:uncharacterized protein YehS (DUF1456 family)
LLAGWEIILPEDRLVEAVPILEEACSAVKVPVYLSRLKTWATEEAGEEYPERSIQHGFTFSDETAFRDWVEEGLGKNLEGFVFNVRPSDSACCTIKQLRRVANELNKKLLVHISLRTTDDRQESEKDDTVIANRVAETALAASARQNLSVFLDTFGIISMALNSVMDLWIRHSIHALPAQY